VTTATKAGLAAIFQTWDLIEPRSEVPWLTDGWMWATNGRLLVALRDDGSPSVPAPEKYLKAKHYLTDALTDAMPCALMQLRRFVGPMSDPMADCDDCDGTGYNDHSEAIKCEHCKQFTRQPCDTCGGDGLANVPVRPARVHGVNVNLELLAQGFTHVPEDGQVQIGRLASIGSKNFPALVVAADDWRVVVMSRRDSGEVLPSFVLNERTESAQKADAVARTAGRVTD
jgi:hypothetical protein